MAISVNYLKPRPWMCDPAIEKLDQIVTDKSTILEFGSGASTIWLAERCKYVVSIEHSVKWAEVVHEGLIIRGFTSKSMVIEAQRQIYGPIEWKSHKDGYNYHFYCTEGLKHATEYTKRFRILIVDGRCRVKCLIEAERYVRKDGWIVFDDSQRKRYVDANIFLESRGWELVTRCQKNGRGQATDFWRMKRESEH